MNSEKTTPSGSKSPIPIVAAVAVLIACSLGLPFATNEYVAIGLIALCSVFLLFVAQRKIATGALIFLLIGLSPTEYGFTVSAVVLSIIVGTALMARMLEKYRSPFLWIIPIASFGAAMLINRSVTFSLLALSFVLPALALYLSFSKGESRVASICLTSAGIFVFFTVFVGALLYYHTGTVDIAHVAQILDATREALGNVLAEFQLELYDGSVETLFSELEAQNLASAVVSLFPAFIIVACNAIAFFAQRILFVLVHRAGETDKLTNKMLALIRSPYAGALFILSFFISTLAAMSSDNALVYTVCQNLFFIFSPGLAASGIMLKLARIAQQRRGAWVVIAFMLMLFVNVGAAVLLAAGLGAYYSIADPLSAFFRSKTDQS